MGRINRWWTFAIVSLALFMGMLDNLVVVTALPAIRQALGASVADLEWTVNAYTLAFTILLLPAAALGDRFGRRRVLLGGIALFTLGSALAALSAPRPALLVPGTEANAAACHRTLPVFDGAVRFDVPLTYARMEPVALDDGFSGEAVVCSARYRPLAGHRPNRSQTKFMTANTDLEYWLVAVPGAPVLAPWRIVVGTQIGRLTVTARRLTLGSAADLDASDAPN